MQIFAETTEAVMRRSAKSQLSTRSPWNIFAQNAQIAERTTQNAEAPPVNGISS
jgi:hypothetical protein